MHELTFDECRDSLRICLRPCHQPKAEDDDPEPTRKTIELDPVNDGAVFAENRFKKKEEGALNIGTNGEKMIAGASEA